MPIRPENVDRYPPSWREISYRIRFVRAEGQCECRGECGVKHDYPDDDGDGRCGRWHGELVERGYWDNRRLIRIVLTCAHLDYTPENCTDENLRAFCQGCHNRYDAPERRRGMRLRALAERKAFAIGDLFGNLPAVPMLSPNQQGDGHGNGEAQNGQEAAIGG